MTFNDAPQPTPLREVRDPRELRALAHPLRLRLIEEIATLGEATATELAERVDESPANCSWHLRQLARSGFIEEAGGGTGRQRPWRWVPQAPTIPSDDGDDGPERRRARDAAVAFLRERDVAAWRAWDAARVEAPEVWQGASFASSSIMWLTAAELAALRDDLQAVAQRHILDRLDRVDPAERPPRTHLVRFGAWAFPAGAPADLPVDADDTSRPPADPGDGGPA